MIYLHPTSQQKIDHYIDKPAQSVLVTGEQGIGFSGIIETVAKGFGVVPYIVSPDKGTITAETIRSLYDITKGRSTSKQLIIIDDADAMSLTAQNAFLKLLEEPSPATYFLLLSHTPSLLLPTIRSRVAELHITPLSTEQSQQLLDELAVKDATKHQQLLFIASGLPALLTTLAADEAAFNARASIVRDARTLLQGSSYQKLQVAQQYKDRGASLMVLQDAARLLKQSTLESNASSTLKRLERLIKSYERIEANGNVRLWLTMAVV